MWILKNSTSLLSSLEKLDLRYGKSVQTFDFSTLYISIPHDLLKPRISTPIQNFFTVKMVHVCPPNFETLIRNFEVENGTLN